MNTKYFFAFLAIAGLAICTAGCGKKKIREEVVHAQNHFVDEEDSATEEGTTRHLTPHKEDYTI